ncbi:MAG: DNA mismatch repair endonuclease MutL [Lachnospiraceae bacterium]|nr:DNA mismatch repair endonuclease MutL [Lachnospiraceae bacterium]
MEHIIHQLDTETINQIAAGEVVERPANVVKELLENAVDAGADAVTVEIKEGGISYIRVTDNGMGIPKDQIPKAFLRHTTSKIACAEDLMHIGSLGFRGEALSSIAAVSRTELLTKTKDALTGTRYCIEGSRETVFEDAGVPDGTTFIVRQLFYNTPARRKFLKTAVTEAGYISDYMEQAMLSHTEIAFKYIAGGNLKLQSFGSGKPLDVIHALYGRDVMENLLPVKAVSGDITVTGYVGRPVLARGSHHFELYYVNQRPIRSKIIAGALNEAYQPYLMQHKFPFVLLYFDLPADMIDVNVHPNKREIRFLQEKALYELIVSTVQEALREQDMTVEVKSEAKKPPAIETELPEPFEKKRREVLNETIPEKLSVQEEALTADAKKLTEPVRTQAEAAFAPPEAEKDQSAETPAYAFADRVEESNGYTVCKTNRHGNDPVREPASAGQLSLFDDARFLSAEAKKRHRLIGQLFKTYWLIEMDDCLFMIDQHAAHEKIKYERLVRQLHENRVYSQYLNPPEIITLTKSEEDTLKYYAPHFAACGFEIESFGGSDYRIGAVPTELYGLTPKAYFQDILDQMGSERLSGDVDEVLHRIATMACKSAVKGNTEMTFQEAEVLIDELMGLEDPYHCPHGRPTILKLKKTEIEKMFKRIV